MKKIFTFSILMIASFVFMQSASALTYNVTVPAGTKACYIAGEMNGWSPSATKMNKLDETHYTIDLPTATAALKYKYCSGPGWAYVEKDAAGAEIQDRTWTANDVVATWASTFVPDERDVTIEVLVPSTTVEVYLVGAFNNWASPSAATKMTYVSADANGKIFTITVHSLDAAKMEFKFCAGPAWSYEQLDPSANFVYGTTASSTAVVVNSFKAIFDPAKTGTINIKATVPSGTDKVWIMGDFIGWNWDNKVEGTKNEDGTFSFAIPMVMSIEYRLYNLPDWSHPEVGEANPTAELPNRKAVYPTDANTVITVWGWKTPTPVENVIADYFKVYSANNTIIVDGVKSKVEIFDMTGRNIEAMKVNGKYTSSTLNRGLYVVRVDGNARKAMVQ